MGDTAAQSNFRTATSHSCHMQSPAGCSWGARKNRTSATGSLGSPEPARKFRRCPHNLSGGRAWHYRGHTSGTQQGLNKRLLNLFSCCVWRPVAPWAWLPFLAPSYQVPQEPEVDGVCVLRPGSDMVWEGGSLEPRWVWVRLQAALGSRGWQGGVRQMGNVGWARERASHPGPQPLYPPGTLYLMFRATFTSNSRA